MKLIGLRDFDNGNVFIHRNFICCFSYDDHPPNLLGRVSHWLSVTGYRGIADFVYRKFVVQTVKAKRDHPREIAPRATTTSPPICASTIQSKACSCLVTCPTTVTKDKRKTIKEKTTETSYFVSFPVERNVLTRRDGG